MYLIEPSVIKASDSVTHKFVIDMVNPITLAYPTPHRLGLVIINQLAKIYVKLGSSAAFDDYSYVLGRNTTLELDYAGQVTAIADAAPSTVMVTETY